MSDLRVLVIENDEAWRDDIKEELERLGEVTVTDVETYKAALQSIGDRSYDLAVVDLSLPDDPNASEESDDRGMDLLRVIRDSPQNSTCGLIVLTAWATNERIILSFSTYHVDYFIEKQKFHHSRFVDKARAAILAGRLRQAQAREHDCYHLNITFDTQHLLSSEIKGPDRNASYISERPAVFEVEDLARRANSLNLLILEGGADFWRPEARSIGRAIYDVLATDRRILGDLVAARALARRFSDLRLQFTGPAVGLGIPFELLRDEDDYLGLNHVLTRRVIRRGPVSSRKPESFAAFIENLKTTLRILIVGANSDGLIPAAESEATALAVAIETDLQCLGINHEIKLLIGDDANYDNVRSALLEGGYHIFHYAGHGRFDDEIAEVSGLILKDGAGHRTLTADVFSQIVSDTPLRLTYLSCCLGARTTSQLGRGDFYGLLDGLVRADVPITLGYRWTVMDGSAMLLAMIFYQMLWRTLSPGEALLQARRSAAIGEQGRDDETWASPILVMQNV